MRDLSRLRPASARRVTLRLEQRLERIRRVVTFMERTVGRGWAWRMEHRDHVMCEDMPKSWLVDRKRPKEASVRRLEYYAMRFGYVLPSGFVVGGNRAAADALASLDVSPEVLENFSGAGSVTSRLRPVSIP